MMLLLALLAPSFPKIPGPLAEETTVTISFAGAGSIQIKLAPDLSPESAAYMKEAAKRGCAGELYRNEDFLLQGKLECPEAKTQVVKGPCPAGIDVDSSRQCPPHDPNW